MPKEYSEHKYNNGLCSCGCWLNTDSSGGPIGLDPKGKCPKNPKDGVPIGGLHDYAEVANERINGLRLQIQQLTTELEKKDKEIKRLKESTHSMGVPELE